MVKSVIIADDSATARMIIKRCLEVAGVVEGKFYEASDGVEALKLAKENEVDLMVTDLNMPNMDGWALLKRIKASPKMHQLPVMVISSACNEKIKNDLLEQGALAVVHKPISPATVATALENITDTNQWG